MNLLSEKFYLVTAATLVPKHEFLRNKLEIIISTHFLKFGKSHFYHCQTYYCTNLSHRVTVLTWSPTSSILYVGTGDGDVIKLNVSNSPTLAFIEPDTEPVVSTR